VRNGEDHAVAVGTEGEHRIVGHAVDPGGAARAPRGLVLLARVAHEHLEVDGGGHLGEVVRDLGGADHEHAPARAVHAGEPIPGAHAFVARARGLEAPGPGGERDVARDDVPLPELGEQRRQRLDRDLGLDQHLDLAPHGSPKRRASSAVTP
jgi:hypothetical protein